MTQQHPKSEPEFHIKRGTARILNAILILLPVAAVSFLFYYFAPLSQQEPGDNEGRILLDTHWMGEGNYALHSPEHNTNGCWSTTLAQISYFHHLQPSGKSSYECSRGYIINENLSGYQFDWNKFTNDISETTRQESIDEVSRYCYAIATIVQKDFGRGRYITMLPPIRKIEQQLDVDARLYLNYNGCIQSRRKFRNIILSEIEANRPLYFYYRTTEVKGSGHSVVLDGYKLMDDKFLVHLNFGWGGRKDGWYNLFEDIATEGDTQLRILITVKPRSSEKNQIV